MSKFQQVYNREEAIRLMRDAVSAAHSAVPDVKDAEDAREWSKAYEAVVSAAPEEIRSLCHTLKRRSPKISLN